MTTRPARPTTMAGKAGEYASHHLRICSSSVVAFSCQPASNGRLSGPAGKTGRPAAVRLRAAVKFRLSAGADVITLFRKLSRPRRSDAASMSPRYLVVHVAARGHLG